MLKIKFTALFCNASNNYRICTIIEIVRRTSEAKLLIVIALRGLKRLKIDTERIDKGWRLSRNGPFV